MKRLWFIFLALVIAAPAWASPLGTAARTAIPRDVQQIISVDYRSLKGSPSAMALKERLLPENLKQFETSLKGIGISPDNDLEQLSFVTFREPKSGLRMIGLAQGNFTPKKITAKMKTKKIKPLSVRTNTIWPMGGGMEMSFLDDSTLLFGEHQALKNALDARDGEAEPVSNNDQMSGLISAVDNGMVWSVLDQQGTQTMMRSALGDAAKLADYETVKKRLLGSHYTMDFGSTVDFNLDVVTSDSVTATAVSSLVKAGMMYKKMTGNGVEKSALQDVSADSEGANFRVHFRSDEKKFQSLINTDMFAAMTK
jgi:hypothetical protein